MTQVRGGQQVSVIGEYNGEWRMVQEQEWQNTFFIRASQLRGGCGRRKTHRQGGIEMKRRGMTAAALRRPDPVEQSGKFSQNPLQNSKKRV